MPDPHAPFALTDAILFTGETFIEQQALLVKAGRIVDIVPVAAIPEGYQRQSYPHAILAPGFIDTQVNGGDNVLLNENPTIEGVLRIVQAHRKTGTTRILPTCVTDDRAIMQRSIEAVRAARLLDTSILGVHQEGPHLNPDYQGAHHLQWLCELSPEDIARYKAMDGEIYILTLAPERTKPGQIQQLVQQGITVCIGHTDATQEQVKAALAEGARGFTHLYTRMPPIRTRAPGVAVYAMNDANSYCGIIGDGAHVDPELIRLALRAKEKDRLYFVSDASPAAGAKNPQPFKMSGVMAYPQDKVCVNESGTIVGAQLTLGECVVEAIKTMKLPPETVLRMASTIPAAFLGLNKKFGYLLPDFQADIVALDHNFKATAVWRSGEKVV